jgi:trehalose 6-phosphate phosphatase
MSSPSDIAAVIDGALVAADFDGTLAAIVAHPADSRPAAGAGEVLLALANAGATVAIVTGRTAEAALQASGFEDIPGVVVEGQYGAERWHDHKLDTLPAPASMGELRNRLPNLIRELTDDPNVWIEDKGISLVVHARQSRDPDAILDTLHDPVTELATSTDVEVHVGKLVLEIRLAGVDKASAIERLARDTPTAIFFAGDDFGDIPAFKAVHEWRRRTGRPALTIGVVPHAGAPVAGIADMEVDDPAAVIEVLNQLLPRSQQTTQR